MYYQYWHCGAGYLRAFWFCFCFSRDRQRVEASTSAFKGLYLDCDAFFIASTASSADIKGVVFTAFTAP
jgi:hypothetical protein